MQKVLILNLRDDSLQDGHCFLAMTLASEGDAAFSRSGDRFNGGWSLRNLSDRPPVRISADNNGEKNRNTLKLRKTQLKPTKVHKPLYSRTLTVDGVGVGVID
jgi:hypothetical protein